MSTFSTLKIELIGAGEQAGVWGLTTNNNFGDTNPGSRGLEQAIVGMATLVTGDFVANVCTLTYADTNAAQDFRAFVLNVTATLTGAGEILVPAIEKPYLVFNDSIGGHAITIKVSGQTGVVVPHGSRMFVYNNGTDVGHAINTVNTITSTSITDTSLSTLQAVFTDASKRLVSNAVTGTGNVVMSNSPSLVTPILGTPASANLQNCTAGGGNVVGVSDTQTLTNKRVTPRIGTTVTGATITPTADLSDQYNVTALSQTTNIAIPSGTPTDGQRLVLRFLDDGTPRAITWATGSGGYRAVGVNNGILPTSTTANKVLYVGALYNAAANYWDVVAVAEQT
jgi:hypothetical protein